MFLTHTIPGWMAPRAYWRWAHARKDRVHSRRAQRKHDKELAPLRSEWSKRWQQCHGWRPPPGLVGAVTYPPDGPSGCSGPVYQSWTFEYAPGTQFAAFEGLERELASVLKTQMVVVRRLPANEERQPEKGAAGPLPEENLRYFAVSAAMNHWGSAPHLNGDLEDRAAVFAALWATTRAFSGLGLPVPLLVEARRLPESKHGYVYERGGVVVWYTVWALPETLRSSELSGTADALREIMGCEYLALRRKPEAGNVVSLVFGAHPSSLRESRAHDILCGSWTEVLDESPQPAEEVRPLKETA